MKITTSVSLCDRVQACTKNAGVGQMLGGDKEDIPATFPNAQAFSLSLFPSLNTHFPHKYMCINSYRSLWWPGICGKSLGLRTPYEAVVVVVLVAVVCMYECVDVCESIYIYMGGWVGELRIARDW